MNDKAAEWIINITTVYPVIASLLLYTLMLAAAVIFFIALAMTRQRYIGEATSQQYPNMYIIGTLIISGLMATAGNFMDIIQASMWESEVGSVSAQFANLNSLAAERSATGTVLLKQAAIKTLQFFGLILMCMGFATAIDALKPNSQSSLWGALIKFLLAAGFLTPTKTSELFSGLSSFIKNLN